MKLYSEIIDGKWDDPRAAIRSPLSFQHDIEWSLDEARHLAYCKTSDFVISRRWRITSVNQSNSSSRIIKRIGILACWFDDDAKQNPNLSLFPATLLLPPRFVARFLDSTATRYNTCTRLCDGVSTISLDVHATWQIENTRPRQRFPSTKKTLKFFLRILPISSKRISKVSPLSLSL